MNNLNKIIKKNIVGLVFIKGYSAAVSLLIIPVTLSILGDDKYGVWVTLFNLLLMLETFDLGIGNGLKNKVTSLFFKENTEKVQDYISTAYVVLGATSILFCVLFILPWNYINWADVFNVNQSLNNELKKVVGTTVLLSNAFFFVNLISKILVSLHKAAYSAFFSAISNTLILGVFLAFKEHLKEDLFAVGLIYCLTPVLVIGGLSFWLFFGELKKIRPSFRAFKKRIAKQLISPGSKFFVIQLTTLIIFQTDTLIISHFLTPAEVTPYNIIYRYFSTVIIIVAVVLTPFWSAVNEAYTKKNLGWIRKMFKAQLKYYLILIFLVLAMLAASKNIINIWIGKEHIIPATLSLSMAIFTVITIWNIMIGNVLNGINELAVQVKANLISVGINIPLSIYLIREHGVEGVIISTSISLLIVSFAGGHRVYIKLKNN
jgi:O-antigen/teichoic acid export membrane protein